MATRERVSRSRQARPESPTLVQDALEAILVSRTAIEGTHASPSNAPARVVSAWADDNVNHVADVPRSNRRGRLLAFGMFYWPPTPVVIGGTGHSRIPWTSSSYRLV